jgi:hypothetical protein
MDANQVCYQCDTVPDMNAKHQLLRRCDVLRMNILKIQIVSSWRLNNIALNRLKDMYQDLNSQQNRDTSVFFWATSYIKSFPHLKIQSRVERWRTILWASCSSRSQNQELSTMDEPKGGSDSNWHVQSTNGIIKWHRHPNSPSDNPKAIYEIPINASSTEEFLLWSLWMETITIMKTNSVVSR